MRNYIRHPADIPVQIAVQAGPEPELHQTRNVSRGGLAFLSDTQLAAGTRIRVGIDIVEPQFQAMAIVTHCSRRGAQYLVGVAFTRRDDMYVARMVEQICHIQHYKQQVEEQEGRTLSPQQAASEWISKYASRFPRWGT